MKPLDSQIVTVPAANAGNPGIQKCDLPGSMVLIQKATGLFRMQFDTQAPFAALEGVKISDPTGPFNSLTFYNDSAVPISLTVFVGQVDVDFVGPYTTKPAPTQPLGNIGINSAADITALFGSYVNYARVSNGGNPTALVGDVLTIAGGTYSTQATLVVTEVAHPTGPNGSGKVAGVAILNPGNYSVLPATPNAVTGGSGSGITINLTFASITGAVLGYSGNYLTITNAGPLTIPNGNAINARKSISFTVKTGSAAGLLIQDANGNTIADLPAGATQSFESSGVFQILSDGAGTCTFSVVELYYL